MEERLIIKEFQIHALEDRRRLVRVILPLNYSKSTISYPVLYMHDGQNLVDKAFYSGSSWEVLRTMDEFHEYGKDMIIVGIDCDDKKRILEYSPFITKNIIKSMRDQKIPDDEIRAEADMYGDFILNQVKPYVDGEFRTLSDRDHTYIAGSSCGGIISIYLGIRHQEMFSIIGAFSPAYWFVREKMNDYLRNTRIQYPLRIYHDMGTRENRLRSFVLLRHQKEFHRIITAKIGTENVIMKVAKGALHNEFAWAERFPEFYGYCFEK